MTHGHAGMVEGFSYGLISNIVLELQARQEGAAKWAVICWLCWRAR